MGTYVIEYQAIPRLGMHIVAALIAVLMAGNWPRAAHEWAARGPLFALAAYGVAVGYANRSRMEVSTAGVTLSSGPLPVGPGARPVRREEIRRVYWRYAWQPTRHGGYHFWTAGVEAADGRWLDLAEPGADPAAAYAAAGRIAAALQWPVPPVELQGLPPRHDERELGTALAWVGVLMFTLVWTGVGEALLGP